MTPLLGALEHGIRASGEFPAAGAGENWEQQGIIILLMINAVRTEDESSSNENSDTDHIACETDGLSSYEIFVDKIFYQIRHICVSLVWIRSQHLCGRVQGRSRHENKSIRTLQPSVPVLLPAVKRYLQNRILPAGRIMKKLQPLALLFSIQETLVN